MARIIEITGIPASGKSTFLMKKGIEGFDPSKRKNTQGQKNKFILVKIGYEIWFFILGCISLSPSNLFFFFKSSLHEKGSILQNLNIFRNIIRKFGIRNLAIKENTDCYIDEGISHIPFNLLNSDTTKIIELTALFLKPISLYYVDHPSIESLEKRLNKRGHSRLKYWSTEAFVKKNLEIGELITSIYPKYNISIKMVSSNA